MEDQSFAYYFCILLGAFLSGASISNWELFFTSRRAKFFVKSLGRNGARIFYLALGFLIAGFGIYHLI
ncbi:MAG: immunity 17 family protein [Bacteroidia bacterium]